MPSFGGFMAVATGKDRAKRDTYSNGRWPCGRGELRVNANLYLPEQPMMRVVIVGGGIGGLAAARHLDRRLGGRRDVEVTLVSRDNFFLLSPLLFEACSGVLELRHCAQP